MKITQRYFQRNQSVENRLQRGNNFDFDFDVNERDDRIYI